MFFLYLLPFFFILNGCEKVSVLDPQEGDDFLTVRDTIIGLNQGFSFRSASVRSGIGAPANPERPFLASDVSFFMSDNIIGTPGLEPRLGHRNRVCIYRIPGVSDLSEVERVEPYGGAAYTLHEEVQVGAVYAVYTLNQSYALILVTRLQMMAIRFNWKLSLRGDRNFK